ncbi:MAG TPA: lysophospholipid acyltransferase family protein [Gemmatimonadales bacterium]|jgi:1-acyl-sn-glycerol-3-phosphate acyltransferase
MIAVLRYVLSMFCCTLYHSARVVLAAGRGERYRPGGAFDRIPWEYAQQLLHLNRITAEARGLEQVTGLGPCVYVANHQSWFDILAAVAVLPGSLRFIAKKELGRVPLFGRALRTAGHIEIDRRNLGDAVSAYRNAAQSIRGGLSAVVFAEGTRSLDGRLAPFKKGPFVLAIVAQVPIVPVYIEGGRQVLPKGSIRPRPGPLVLHLGAPIPTTGLSYEDRDQLSARVRAAIVALGARE